LAHKIRVFTHFGEFGSQLEEDWDRDAMPGGTGRKQKDPGDFFD